MKQILSLVLAGTMILGPVLAFGQEEASAGPSKVQLGTAITEEERAMRAFEERVIAQSDQWFADGDYRLVIDTLEMHVGLRPSSYELVTNLGWMYGNIQDGTNELRVYVEYHNRYPNDPEAAYPLGQFYYVKKAYKQAVAVLEPTISMVPHPHPNTYRVLARAYKSLGLLKESERIYLELIKVDPNDAAAKANLAKIREEIKKGGGGG